ncbi:hypothetical protein ACNKHU_15415 [Shigella flexneri]
MTVKAASSENTHRHAFWWQSAKSGDGSMGLCRQPDFVAHEPTRDVDIEAKQQIYRIVRELAAEGKSVVFISSEVEELPLVCDRILLLQHGTFSRSSLAGQCG